jgi:hypothetical protein
VQHVAVGVVMHEMGELVLAAAASSESCANVTGAMMR